VRRVGGELARFDRARISRSDRVLRTAPAEGSFQGAEGSASKTPRAPSASHRTPTARPRENRPRAWPGARGWRAGAPRAAGGGGLRTGVVSVCAVLWRWGGAHFRVISNDERLRLTQRGPHWHTRAPQRAFASRSCSTVTLPPATTHRSLEISLTKSSLCETVTTAPLKPLSACVSAASVSLSR